MAAIGEHWVAGILPLLSPDGAPTGSALQPVGMQGALRALCIVSECGGLP